MEENILIFINDRSEEENVRDDRVDNFSWIRGNCWREREREYLENRMDRNKDAIGGRRSSGRLTSTIKSCQFALFLGRYKSGVAHNPR